MTDGGRRVGADGWGDRCGHTTRGGGTCKRPAGAGTDHVGVGACRLHGGNTPSHKRMIHANQLKDAVAKAYGGRSDVNPFAALLDEIAWTRGHCTWLRRHIPVIDRDGEVDTASPEFRRWKEWVALYRSERKHMIWASQVAITCGVAERLTQLREKEARGLATMVAEALDRAGVDSELRSRIIGELADGYRARAHDHRRAIEATTSPRRAAPIEAHPLTWRGATIADPSAPNPGDAPPDDDVDDDAVPWEPAWPPRENVKVLNDG